MERAVLTLASGIWGLFGLILLESAITKFQQPAAFERAFLGYPFLRRWPGVRGAALIPPLEAAVGVGLLSMQWPASTLAAYGSLVFIAFATVAVALRRLRGERRFTCGCGGNLTAEHSAAWLLTRNLIALAALSWSIFVPAPAVPYLFRLFILLACGAVVLTLRLFTAFRTASNAVREQAWNPAG